MPKIRVLSSTDRYAVLILAVLKYGGVDPTTFETDLKLSGATGLRETLTDQEVGEMLHVANHGFGAEGLGDFSEFKPAEIDEASARHLADALHRQYRHLQELGGKDFGDHLLAGSPVKLKTIRDGAWNTYLGEMAVVLRADQLSREKGVGNDAVTALMLGVDRDAAHKFFSDLPRERQKIMNGLARKLPGVPKRPKPTPVRRTYYEEGHRPRR